jgi:hypothetical protein
MYIHTDPKQRELPIPYAPIQQDRFLSAILHSIPILFCLNRSLLYTKNRAFPEVTS